jgi:hypothetical protein
MLNKGKTVAEVDGRFGITETTSLDSELSLSLRSTIQPERYVERVMVHCPSL